MTLAAAAAIAAAAATAVVALAFALYAMTTPYLGEAGAAAVVAVVAALLVLAAGLFAASKARGAHHPQHHHEAAPDHGMIEMIMNLVRERPLVSAGAAVAVAVFAMRNPSFVAAVVRAFADLKPSHHKGPGHHKG